jgi:hypothetical protein
MKISYNPNSILVLSVSFVGCFLAIGIPYWALPYSQVSLPNTLYGLGLILLFALSAAIRFTASAGTVATIATMAASVAGVVMARVAVDTAADPTSHNLWPFELVIAAFVGIFAAAVGALSGWFVRWLIQRVGSGGRR